MKTRLSLVAASAFLSGLVAGCVLQGVVRAQAAGAAPVIATQPGGPWVLAVSTDATAGYFRAVKLNQQTGEAWIYAGRGEARDGEWFLPAEKRRH